LPNVEYTLPPVLPSGKRAIPPATALLLARPMPVGSRHHACEKILVSLRYCGYDEVDLIGFGLKFCRLNAFPEGEMRYMVRWVCRSIVPCLS